MRDVTFATVVRRGEARGWKPNTEKELPPMPPIISVVIFAFTVIVFVAMLVDALTAGLGGDGQPRASLTYRAYGA